MSAEAGSITPVKTVAALKVWQLILLIVGIGVALLAAGWAISNWVLVKNVVTSSTGETFIRTSFLKPLKKAEADKVADQVVTGKKKKDKSEEEKK